ncbi:hypothetical protein Tsubulata_051029 [Turnera subulata]|uniref:Uncharacterized protein n=1 Tax=Turnera subulata TaxID=218843 RepID=A0A9Q0FP97_9ROSI|nr:hypothetical protein Tsubulata_051029 [Turnera subulata]
MVYMENRPWQACLGLACGSVSLHRGRGGFCSASRVQKLLAIWERRPCSLP